MAGIVVVGEGMVELAPGPNAGGWRVGQGGDTLNTAIHLARLGDTVGFLTALGTDPFSLDLRRRWQAEGLDPAFVLTDSTRRAGLYAITNDPDGERHFTYWRSESAARQVFALPGIDAALVGAATADLLVFSMISLAILPPDGRERRSISPPVSLAMVARWRSTPTSARPCGPTWPRHARRTATPWHSRPSGCRRWRTRPR